MEENKTHSKKKLNDIVNKWQFVKLPSYGVSKKHALCINPYNLSTTNYKGVYDYQLFSTFCIGFIGIPCSHSFMNSNGCFVKISIDDYFTLNKALRDNNLTYNKKKKELIDNTNGELITQKKRFNY